MRHPKARRHFGVDEILEPKPSIEHPRGQIGLPGRDECAALSCPVKHGLDEESTEAAAVYRRVNYEPVDGDLVGVLGSCHSTRQTVAGVRAEPVQRCRTQVRHIFMQRWDAIIADQRRLHPVGGALNGEQPVGKVLVFGRSDRLDVHGVSLSSAAAIGCCWRPGGDRRACGQGGCARPLRSVQREADEDPACAMTTPIATIAGLEAHAHIRAVRGTPPISRVR